jgi:adenylate kinase
VAAGEAPGAGARATPAPRAAGRLRVVLLGRQGSGKGTQAERLSVAYRVPHVSTGEAFRAAVKDGTDLGKAVQGYMERGELVPDDLVTAVIKEHLFGPGATEGFVLDGFPRNLAQAEALDEMAGPRGLDVVVSLEAPTEEVLRRLSARRVCPVCGATYNLLTSPPQVPGRCDACGSALYQRDDDTEQAIRRRLELYEAETAPLSGWYRERELLTTVDATGSPDEVAERVEEAVAAALATKAG